MKLLPNEQESVNFVVRIGQKRAERILNAITRRFDRRYNKALNCAMVPLNPEWIIKTPLEVKLTYWIKIGLTLTDDDNTPAAAKQRIRKRIDARNALRKARNALK